MRVAVVGATGAVGSTVLGVMRERGFPAVTLTTFRDVVWNAPYYERCGFRILLLGEVTPELAAIRRQEAERGFDQWPRVCMRREIEP